MIQSRNLLISHVIREGFQWEAVQQAILLDSDMILINSLEALIILTYFN